MEIAIVGPGRIGGNIARQLARAGHAVTVCFSRDPAALAERAGDWGVRTAGPPRRSTPRGCPGRATRSRSTR
jgi:3-hydroxyisobutyrate dehydrogenase-like beta-hydroxyacid dehydrogenase